MLTVVINNEEKVTVTLQPMTASGNPALLDGVPSWSQVSGDATFNVSADGLSIELVSSDAPGVSEFAVTADADLGEGVKQLNDGITLVVVSAEATSLGLFAGAPVLK